MTTEDKERIEKEAAKHARFNHNHDVVEGAEYRGYIAGATVWSERAQQELQAYRDKLKNAIAGRDLTYFEILELIDTVTPT